MYNAKRRESINDLFFYPVQGLLLLCAVRIYAYPTGDRFKFKVYSHNLYSAWKDKKNRRACADYFHHRNASPRTKGMLEKVSLDLLSRSKSITELSGCHV